jgi:hypothetical protein
MFRRRDRIENGEPADAGVEHQNALSGVNHLGRLGYATCSTKYLI